MLSTSTTALFLFNVDQKKSAVWSTSTTVFFYRSKLTVDIDHCTFPGGLQTGLFITPFVFNFSVIVLISRIVYISDYTTWPTCVSDITCVTPPTPTDTGMTSNFSGSTSYNSAFS